MKETRSARLNVLPVTSDHWYEMNLIDVVFDRRVEPVHTFIYTKT